MLRVKVGVEVILKYQVAHSLDVFFDMQEAVFEVEIPKETTADAFEDVAIDTIAEEEFLKLAASKGQDADVIGVAVTRVVSITMV